MEDNKPDIKLETYTIIIPYCTVVFGRVFEMPLECVFGYSGDFKTNHVLEIISLTGTDEEGILFGMDYLLEDEKSPLAIHIVSCITSNSSAWNLEVESGVWWDTENIFIATDK